MVLFHRSKANLIFMLICSLKFICLYIMPVTKLEYCEWRQYIGGMGERIPCVLVINQLHVILVKWFISVTQGNKTMLWSLNSEIKSVRGTNTLDFLQVEGDDYRKIASVIQRLIKKIFLLVWLRVFFSTFRPLIVTLFWLHGEFVLRVFSTIAWCKVWYSNALVGSSSYVSWVLFSCYHQASLGGTFFRVVGVSL